jgi:hypothetical protein
MYKVPVCEHVNVHVRVHLHEHEQKRDHEHEHELEHDVENKNVGMPNAAVKLDQLRYFIVSPIY